MNTHRERVRRREAMHQAIGSARIEGQEPTPKSQAVLDDFVAGRIDGREMMRLLLDQR